ncbi:hypothetical protein M514_00429, partial [Trichuris suis]
AKRRNISGRHGSGKDLQHAVAYCSEQWSSTGTPHLFHSPVRAGGSWVLSGEGARCLRYAFLCHNMSAI